MNSALAPVAGAMKLIAELRREVEQAAAQAVVEPEFNTYDIIIPVFNDRAGLLASIRSLLAQTGARHTLHLVDNASTDPQVKSLLDETQRAHSQVRISTLPVHLGFSGAVNYALIRTTRDVVLMGSGTEVPNGWLARLDRCRQSSSKLAAISPLSNTGDFCTMPCPQTPGPLPPGQSLTSMDACVATTSLRRYPSIPSASAFCMLITRSALNAIGPFDSAFIESNLAEIDFCQRAWANGLPSTLCDDLFVLQSSAPAAPMPTAQQLQRQELLLRRFANYRKRIASFSTRNPLGFAQKRFLTTQRNRERSGGPRILHVVHDFQSRTGTAKFVQNLVSSLNGQAEQSILYPLPSQEPRDATLKATENLLHVAWNPFSQPVHHTIRGGTVDLLSAGAERFFAETLLATRPEVVHFSHLANLGSFALPALARAAGARVVMVLHDFYLLCPDWNLLDRHRRACGKPELNSSPDCQACIASKQRSAPGAPPLLRLENWITERQMLARAAASQAHSLLAPSEFVKQQFASAWGKNFAERIVVIGHGTEPAPAGLSFRQKTQATASPLRVAFLGNFLPEKGSLTFLQAARILADQGSRIELQILGATAPIVDPPPNISPKGAYDLRQLPSLLGTIDIVVVASVWHEVYCYTVDEALRLGTPVVATRVGALPERVKHDVNGLLVSPGNAEQLAQALMKLENDRQLLGRITLGARNTQLTTAEQSLKQYGNVLLKPVEHHCELPAAAPAPAPALSPTRHP